MNNALAHLVTQLPYVLPMLLVWLVGAVVALVNWQRCPSSSLLVLLAMLDFAFFRVLTSVLQVIVLSDGARSMQNVGTLMSIVGVVGTLGAIVGYVMLLAAVFIGRQNPSPQYGVKPML